MKPIALIIIFLLCGIFVCCAGQIANQTEAGVEAGPEEDTGPPWPTAPYVGQDAAWPDHQPKKGGPFNPRAR